MGTPRIVEFSASAPDELVEAMRPLLARHSGWVNFRPRLGDDDTGVGDPPPAQPGLFGILSSKGTAVPWCTWVPGAMGRGGPGPDSLGIQHPAGVRARDVLRPAGVLLPDGWRLRSDHPRRGLVVEAPPGTDPTEVVAWLLRASAALATGPLPDVWLAAVHER